MSEVVFNGTELSKWLVLYLLADFVDFESLRRSIHHKLLFIHTSLTKSEFYLIEDSSERNFQND